MPRSARPAAAVGDWLGGGWPCYMCACVLVCVLCWSLGGVVRCESLMCGCPTPQRARLESHGWTTGMMAAAWPGLHRLQPEQWPPASLTTSSQWPPRHLTRQLSLMLYFKHHWDTVDCAAILINGCSLVLWFFFTNIICLSLRLLLLNSTEEDSTSKNIVFCNFDYIIIFYILDRYNL